MIYFKVLGKGKDGVVYYRKTLFGKNQIIKKLSDYGKAWNIVTMEVSKRLPKARHFVDLRVEENSHKYPAREDFNPVLSVGSIPFFLSEISRIQTLLIPKGLLYWDWGYSAPNYRYDMQGIYIIDYGGNAWLFLNENPNKDKELRRERRMIFMPNSKFLAVTLLLHICKFYLNEVEIFNVEISKLIQKDISYCEKLTSDLLEIFKKHNLGELSKLIADTNLLNLEGWQQLRGFVRAPQELPDIDEIKFGLLSTTVLGYQNYIIKKNEISSLNLGHRWANSIEKFQIISKILNENKYWCNSFMDIGSNLGMYVFYAAFLGYESLGFDYNPVYTAVCRKLSEKQKFNQNNFRCSNFSQIKRTADIVFVGALIHHLYCRTEDYNSLDPILSKIADITTKIAIVEFPSESDSKAEKWTKNDIRYSRVNFFETAMKYFTQIVKVAEIKSANIDRQMYLLMK